MSLRVRKLISRVLKKGKNNIWIDPVHQKDVAKINYRSEVRENLKSGKIKIINPIKPRGKSPSPVQTDKKVRMDRVRKLRAFLKENKAKLEPFRFRELYLKIKDGRILIKSRLVKEMNL